ncbi:MAG: LysR family transcriptional regulator [Sporomusaceae bacterium]|nr:LysR family transcriptional regulator [Sporomusaceae bacterium]
MNNKSINFEQYKVFFHVAKTLSFSKAAEALFISQSAVSQSIRQLEKELRTPLFSRTTKQVRLTQAGGVLFHHVKEACQLLELGERALDNLQDLSLGEIRLGASDTICRYYLLPFLAHFKKKYPPIKITLINRPSPICLDLLKAGDVDLSIVNMASQPSDPFLQISPLVTIHDVIVASPQYPALPSTAVLLKDLVEFPFILLEKNSTTRRYVSDFLAAQNINLAPEIELGSLDLCLDFARAGLGLTFAVREFITKDLTENKLREIALTQTLPPRQIGLLTHSRIPLSAAAQTFCELLLQPSSMATAITN